VSSVTEKWTDGKKVVTITQTWSPSSGYDWHFSAPIICKWELKDFIPIKDYSKKKP